MDALLNAINFLKAPLCMIQGFDCCPPTALHQLQGTLGLLTSVSQLEEQGLRCVCVCMRDRDACEEETCSTQSHHSTKEAYLNMLQISRLELILIEVLCEIE